jgi:hypothetical protein
MAFINKYSVNYPPKDTSPMIDRYACSLWDQISINVIHRDTQYFHSHPWDYISFILWGGYYESIHEDGNVRTVWRGPGSLLFRKHSAMHSLVVPKKTYTLFFRSKPKVKSTKIIKDGKVMSDVKVLMVEGYSKKQIKDYVNKMIGK